ncbi:hypothetical protein [Luteimonas sp. MC1825]|uniref:hypothetical protein n=1 Tax=Luteimonas sp. MC1825 TaxID=2761107 RepID=UPI001619D404|nr:hypothetical protein [Luteimonas sp. MC1825]MBB6600292.1 hypothetical protein [Luteimonas sp. MC1825]QOC87972.1 hypothetical protein IDM46_12240 [Luteimonas sp. MC1825]
MGLVLAADDCAKLAAGLGVEQAFFKAVIYKQMIGGELLSPTRGRFGSSLRPDGWHISAYKKITSADEGDWSAHDPISVKVAPVNVYARDVDVDTFIVGLRTYAFIDDLFLDNERIVDELPSYVSGKLTELVDANRIFWRNANEPDVSEKARRRAGASNYLQEDFLDLCGKTSKPNSLLAFAIDACDPTALPHSKRLLSTSVTPAMLALLTASKLYWSAHCALGQTRDTYPDQEAILSFLRFMGLQTGNTAASGRTLIRPEGVRSPDAQPDWLTTIMRRRKGSAR